MKKIILAALVFSFIGITSCKKDAGAQPDSTNTVKVLDKKDTSQWD